MNDKDHVIAKQIDIKRWNGRDANNVVTEWVTLRASDYDAMQPVETTEHQLPPHDYTHPDWQGNGVTKFWTEDSLRAYAAVPARSSVEPTGNESNNT